MEDRQDDRRYHNDRKRSSRSPFRRDARVGSDREPRRAHDRRSPSPHHKRRTRHHEASRSRSPYQRPTYDSSSPDSRRPSRTHRSSSHHRSKRHRSSLSPSPPPARSKHRSRSPKPASPFKRSAAPLPSQQAAFTADPTALSKPAPAVEKQKPNFAPSGLLAAETNTVAGTTIVLKYNEPPESRKPPTSQQWRLYVFKGKETLETLELFTRSCWLFGRERAVVDYAVEHPSCSKQHAVVQFRYVEKKNEYGDKEGGVRPYVIDLESANGTKVNGEKVPERRYVELMSGDVLEFGDSTREYVLLLPPKG